MWWLKNISSFSLAGKAKTCWFHSVPLLSQVPGSGLATNIVLRLLQKNFLRLTWHCLLRWVVQRIRGCCCCVTIAVAVDPEVSDWVFANVVLVPVENSAREVDAKLFDGTALVQMLGPKLMATFQEYLEVIFLPYIKRQFDSVKRIDIMFDVYKSDSLKSSTRERRGCGVRRRVLTSAQIPGNWQSSFAGQWQ